MSSRRVLPLALLVLLLASPWLVAAEPAAPAWRIATLLKSAKIYATAVGVDASFQPFGAVLHSDHHDLQSKRARILLVGRSKAAADQIAESMQWFYTAEAAAELRRHFILAAVPLAPIADEQAVFPSEGKAYNDPDHPQTTYLWRWIGMHAPDLVVEVDVVDASETKAQGWFVPVSDITKDLAPKLHPRIAGRKYELATALVNHAPCKVGRVAGIRVNLSGKSSYLTDLLAAMQEAAGRALGPSPARAELLARQGRTPIVTAQRLAKSFGDDLRSVVYIPTLALVGRVRLGELTNTPSHFEDVRRIVKPYVDGDKPTKPTSGSALSGHLIFSQLAQRSKGIEQTRLLELAQRASNLGLNDQGEPRPSMPFHLEMSDSLFMGGPILAETGALTGEDPYFEACLKHLQFMRKLVLRSDGIYRHSPLDESAWGRGNGFPALGVALCLSAWPQDRSDRADLVAMHKAHLTALLKHQDPSGCWRQVIDEPATFREFTCTCMITFAMARGVNQGWLDRKTYDAAIRRAWPAINARIADNGELVDVCTGTGKMKSLQDYYHRTAILGKDGRGGAMALMATTELAEYFQAK